MSTPSSKTSSDNVHACNKGTNWVKGGVESNPFFFTLLVAAPFLSLLLSYLTSEELKTKYPQVLIKHPLSSMLPLCFEAPQRCALGLIEAGISVFPGAKAVMFVGSFMIVALLLELLPGKVQSGPQTLTGHIPKYIDNGLSHSLVFSFLFWVGSNLGYGGLYDFGIFYDVFCGAVASLNIFGICFCMFLTFKGLFFPSTEDCGSSGSLVKDYLWGTELYPRVFGLDIKRFINCRFSMTFWQLAGLSYAYRSFTLHHQMDWGLLFSALSQYIYLFKFFLWEMGYMRSIDIIADRAGFEIQWGCLVWVPAVYTLHTRFSVQYPSLLPFHIACFLFILSVLAIGMNYAADHQRDIFRATRGTALVWGKKPEFITAKYIVQDSTTGEDTVKESLLLVSGYWGLARHFQYASELVAAYCWCFLANPIRNGVFPLFYAVFLTFLLIHRAKRDEEKCLLKYGKYYAEYCRKVPFRIFPYIY